jgi:hypothetical protein
MGFMDEKKLDEVIANLVVLKNGSGSFALGPAIDALKEYRDRRMHWKNLAQGIRALNALQIQHIKETDKLRRVLIGKGD